MSMLSKLLQIFLIALFINACQIEEKQSAAELVAAEIAAEASAIVDSVVDDVMDSWDGFENEENLNAIEDAFELLSEIFDFGDSEEGEDEVWGDDDDGDDDDGDDDDGDDDDGDDDWGNNGWDEEGNYPGGGDEEEGMDSEEFKTELKKILTERIFHAENVEEVLDDGAVFLLKGSVICAAPEGEPADEEFQECESTVDDLELRVSATEDNGTVELSIFIGSDRFNPLNLTLAKNLIAVEVDLGAIKASFEHIANTMGEDEMPIDEIQTLAGIIKFTLEFSETSELKFSVSVLSAIAVEANMDEDVIKFNMGAGENIVALSLNGSDQTVDAVVDIPAVDLTMPVIPGEEEPEWDEGWENGGPGSGNGDDPQGDGEEAESVGILSVHLSGLSLSVSLTADAESLSVTNIGLGEGTTSATFNEEQIFSLDLNKDHNRTFDLSVTPLQEEESALFRVEPALVVAANLAFAPLLDALESEDAPEFIRNDTLGLALTGENGASVKPIEGNNEDSEGGLQIVEGSLTLSSSAAEINLVVEAGQCLVPVEVEEADDEESEPHFFEYFGAGSCN